MALTAKDFIALNRFGLGWNGDDAAAFGDSGPLRWLDGQMQDSNAALFDSGLPPLPELVANIAAIHQMKDDPASKRDARKDMYEQFLSAQARRFAAGVMTSTPFAERLALFWSNHFTVSLASKPVMGPLVCAFENDAIRPHIFGRFEDMLLAATRHPAMLIYLDNHNSIGPNSIAGQRRKAGLNENLARELMELHTLGVDGGYKQDDVTEMARILTGWTIVPPKLGGGGFLYIDRMHEPGGRTLLGKEYAATGEQQGLDALHDLAGHPSTAHHIAKKLALHFIADEPPPQAINAIADAFTRSGGDLPSVYRAMAALPDIWAALLPKIKTPYELMLSSFRLFAIPPDTAPDKKIFNSLALMDQKPFFAPSPAGWPDRADDWLAPGALMNRIEWCHALAQKIPSSARISPTDLAQTALGPALKPGTLDWIGRAPSPADGYALVLASAEFQRR